MTTATRLLILLLLGCALAVGAANAQSSTQTQTIERVVHVAPFGAKGERYAYVPFDVPRGAARVRVSYEYAREDGANTIDLGIFDSRGFRGWSGGRRSEFFIAREEATPGYLAGELPAGRWRVILGLYKVAPAGVDVKVKVLVETSGAVPRLRARDASGAESGAKRAEHKSRWFAGDLHMHTLHSDGDWTVRGLADSALEAGLDFIFVTDHNTSSHHADVAEADAASQRLLVMRGEEVTTYGGHANAWGLPEGALLDFRVRPGDAAAMAQVAARAHRLGALISVNHPAALCGGCDWSYGDAIRQFDAIEVWNGVWDATDEAALKLWDGLLQRGARLTAIASSDSHREQNAIGRPTTHVAAAELSQAALLGSIRGGRVYLTRETRGLSIEFEAAAGQVGAAGARRGPGEEVRMRAPGTLLFFVKVGGAPAGANVSLHSGGRVLKSLRAQSQFTEVFEIECERDGYYRLEVRDEAGAMLALTNPVYVNIGRRRR